MKVWWYDNKEGDPREDHFGSAATLGDLAAAGVEYFSFPPESHETDPDFKQLCQSRGYKNSDLVTISRTSIPSYEEKMKIFFEEHLHDDEEIRFFLDGSGFFDVRSPDDRWLRICGEKGDLLIVPAGIYHRFSPDTKEFASVRRIFTDAPKWVPINRADLSGHELENESRRIWLSKYAQSSAVNAAA
eukprot:CAMPEP_0196651648 /NCGR_PEP_ID=MMETSP1086-20130531/680_1 /TAXON_ID=77921 /ORGANISM="Cyanoptyche  gloeocystis , Strain SAG4.97" /LENGTH=186 /DNA_ID=CAMNT_0041981753 /DNA_START=8 /DNA_END=568 /DNA_ORIENTATION=+